MDINGTWWYTFLVTSRWIGFRLDFMTTLLTGGSVIVALLLKDYVSDLIFQSTHQNWVDFAISMQLNYLLLSISLRALELFRVSSGNLIYRLLHRMFKLKQLNLVL